MMSKHNSFRFTTNGVAALVMIVGVLIFLLMEYREHLFAAMPFLLLVICVLTHLFMHGGHGNGSKNEGGGSHDSKSDS